MNRIFHRYGQRVLLCLLTVLSVMLTSCIDDYDNCPAAGEDDGSIYLKVRVLTRSVGSSRAPDIAGDETGFSYENFIDVNDIRFIIFDNAGNLISDITPSAEIKAGDETYSYYDITAKLDDPFFVDNINSNNINFYILVLANYSGWGITLPPLQTGTTLSDLFAGDRPLTVLPSTAGLMNAGTNEPGQQLFPMAGLQHFIITGLNLLNTTENQPYNLSDVNAGGKNIYMLRSLAKIEIIDRINVPEEEGYVFNDNGKDSDSPLRIDKAEIDGYFDQGLLLPARAQWERNDVNFPETQQVIAPLIPETASYRIPPTLGSDNTYAPEANFSDCLLNFAYDAAATNLRKDKCPVYSCYVFEYASNRIGGTSVQAPYFRVTTRGSNSGDEHYESLILPFRMIYTDNDGIAHDRTDLLRNHIYRYEITGISQQVEFNWTVCPMDEAPEINIEFN